MHRVFRAVAVWVLTGVAGTGAPPLVTTTNLGKTPPDTATPNLVSLFQVKRGFRIELVAAAPMVNSPAALAFDENGRLFVAEMRDYPNRHDQTPHLGRIRMLQDTDGDGIYDSSTVYADELPAPSAIFCYGGGVFVAAAPDILFFKDVKNTGVADVRRIVFTGFGEPGAGVEGKALPNNFTWGLDNRIHAASGEFGGKIVTGGAEPLQLANDGFSFDPVTASFWLESGAADTGCTFDNRGHKYVCDFYHPLRAVMLQHTDIARSAFSPAPFPLAECASSAAPIYRFSSGAPNPARTVNVGSAGFTSIISDSWKQARGCVIYRGSAFPSNYFENAFIPDTDAHVVHRAILRENGLDITAERAPEEQNTEFLLSRDPSFHPFQIVNGPEGALYIADIMTGGDSGRIFRILPDTARLAKIPTLTNSVRELVVTLANPNGWHRDTAARLLVERHDASAIPLLTLMLNNSRLPYARLSALCALDGLGALSDGIIQRAVSDLDESVRERGVMLSVKLAQAARLSEALWGRLKMMSTDPSARVRYALLLAAGQINQPDRFELLSGLFTHAPENPWLQEALLCSANQGAADLLNSLASGSGWSDTNSPNIISRLALSIGLQSRPTEARQIVDNVVNSRFTDLQAFTILAALGEGLHRAGNSLAAADPQNRLQRFYERGLEVTFNDSLPEQVRVPAIHFRAVTPVVDYGTGDILQLMFGTSQSDAIQSAALSTLAQYANPAVPGKILQRWPELTPRIRSRALSALLTRGDWAEEVIAAAESGRINPGDFSSCQLDLLRNWPEKKLSDRALHVFGPSVTRRAEAMDAFASSLTMPASRERGGDIYLARCVSCHRAADGRQPLPLNLAHVKSWPRQKLLSAIVEPNAEVHAQWGTYFVQNKLGEVWTGIVTDDNSVALTVEIPGGESFVLPRGTVHFVQLQTWSLMPAGLENGMTPQNVADLIEFLCPR